MLRKRIFASLLIVVLMLAFSSVTSVFAASEITWDVISNDQIMTNVTDNLNLVKTLDNGADVTWTSSKPYCVDTNGVVTRWDKDEAVTLTAAYGSVTRTYDIIVSSCENGTTKWKDDNFVGKTMLYHNVNWTDSRSSSNDQTHSPKVWKYDAENDRLYTETQYGTWGSNYGLTIDGATYKWNTVAEVKADTRLKSVDFNYNGTDCTLYYVDKAYADADNNPYRIGVVVKGGTTLTNWTSLYVIVDEETGAVSVDTTKTLDVALEGYIKQNLEPVTLSGKNRSHLLLSHSGFNFAFTANNSKLTDGYERFSFRYRQQRKGGAERWEPYFSFFYNNQHFAISPNMGPGATTSTLYYGYIYAWYTDDFTKKEDVNYVTSGPNCMLGSVTEPLEIKTSTDGLTGLPQLTGADYDDWREIIMETDIANSYTVMYMDGSPVYWKVVASGVTYYTPFLVYTKYTGSNSADVVRAGFSCPNAERLYTDFEVENAKLERITANEMTAVAAGATVTSVEGNDAVINFARKGNYTVIFAEYGEGDALAGVSMKSVTVTKTGDTTVTANASPAEAWDKIFIWSSHGALIPLCASANVADIPAAE